MFTRKPDRSEAKPATAGNADQDKKSDTPDTPPPIALKLSTPLKELSQMAPSVIGGDLTVEGNVISKGEVQLEGKIKGDCHCISLVIGDKASIEGGVVAEDVIVRGRVVGSVRGHRVTLQSSSHVEGDIFHQSLAIEQGAFFEGKSRRSDDPIADAKTSLSSSKSDFGSGSSGNSSCSSGSASSDSSSSSQSTRAAE